MAVQTQEESAVMYAALVLKKTTMRREYDV